MKHIEVHGNAVWEYLLDEDGKAAYIKREGENWREPSYETYIIGSVGMKGLKIIPSTFTRDLVVGNGL